MTIKFNWLNGYSKKHQKARICDLMNVRTADSSALGSGWRDKPLALTVDLPSLSMQVSPITILLTRHFYWNSVLFQLNWKSVVNHLSPLDNSLIGDIPPLRLRLALKLLPY